MYSATRASCPCLKIKMHNIKLSVIRWKQNSVEKNIEIDYEIIKQTNVNDEIKTIKMI